MDAIPEAEPYDAARQRYAVAGRVSRDLAQEPDLATLLGLAKLGLGELFEGDCTIQVGIRSDSPPTLQQEWIPVEGLMDHVASGLSEHQGLDVESARDGLLLVPYSSSGVCRAWVQFPAPRRVSIEEHIIGDLLAQAFAIAVDRIVDQEHAATRETQLRQAVEGHQIIGQATGIMMERHRLSAPAAFDLLRVASQHRNLKLREIAQRVVDSGEEPDRA